MESHIQMVLVIPVRQHRVSRIIIFLMAVVKSVNLGVHVRVVQRSRYAVVHQSHVRLILVVILVHIMNVHRINPASVINHVPRLVRGMIHRLVRTMRHVHMIHRIHIQVPSIMVEVVAQPRANVRSFPLHVILGITKTVRVLLV